MPLSNSDPWARVSLKPLDDDTDPGTTLAPRERTPRAPQPSADPWARVQLAPLDDGSGNAAGAPQEDQTPGWPKRAATAVGRGVTRAGQWAKRGLVGDEDTGGLVDAAADMFKGRQHGYDSYKDGVLNTAAGMGHGLNRDRKQAEAARRIEAVQMRPEREQKAQREQEGRDLAVKAQDYLKEHGVEMPEAQTPAPLAQKTNGLKLPEQPEDGIYGPEGGGPAPATHAPAEDYRTIVRRAMQRDQNADSPNKRMTIFQRAAKEQGIGDEDGFATIDPATMDSEQGASDIIDAIQGGAKLSTFFGDKSEDEIVAQLAAMDEAFTREYLVNQAKMKPRNWGGKVGEATVGLVQGAAEYSHPVSVGRIALGANADARAAVAAAPQLQLDEAGEIQVVAPGRKVTSTDIFKAYGSDASAFIIERFTMRMLRGAKSGAVKGLKMTKPGRAVVAGADDAARWAAKKKAGLMDKNLVKAVTESRLGQMTSRIRHSRALDSTKKVTGLGSMWEEYVEEGVEALFSEPAWNLDRADGTFSERMKVNAVEFAYNTPYLLAGLALGSVIRMGGVAPFERASRRKMAAQDAKDYTRALEAVGVDNIKEGEAERFLNELYGTGSVTRGIKVINGFLEKHGVDVAADGPVVQAMHQAFAQQDRELHPRQRFLRGLQKGWHKERAQRTDTAAPDAASGQSDGQGATGPQTQVDSGDSALDAIVPEYSGLVQFARNLAGRPVDMTTGEKVLSENEQQRLQSAEQEQDWDAYLKAAGGNQLLALFAKQQDQAADMVTSQQPTPEDNLDMNMQPAAQPARRGLKLDEQDERAESLEADRMRDGMERERAEAADNAEYAKKIEDMMQARGKSGQERPDAAAVTAAAGQTVETTPSEAQKEAGNYKKAHVRMDGFEVSIENPAGSERSGQDRTGREWRQEMKADYGYIRGTTGYDKDHVDVFIKPGYQGGAERVHVVNQVDPQTGKFDEHKVVFGAANADEAQAVYAANYEPGWKGGRDVVEMSAEQFKQWLASDGPKKGAAAGGLNQQATPATSPVAAEKPVKSMSIAQIRAELHQFGIHRVDGKDVDGINSIITLRKRLSIARDNLANKQQLEAAHQKKAEQKAKRRRAAVAGSQRGQFKSNVVYTQDDRVTPVINEINRLGAMHKPQWTKPGKLAGPRKLVDGNYDGIIDDGRKLAVPAFMGVFTKDGANSPDQMLAALSTTGGRGGEAGVLPEGATLADMWEAIRDEVADYKHWKATDQLPKRARNMDQDELAETLNQEEDERWAEMGADYQQAVADLEQRIEDGSILPPQTDVYADGVGDETGPLRIDSAYVGNDFGLYYDLTSYATDKKYTVPVEQVTGRAQMAEDALDFDVESIENESREADDEQRIGNSDGQEGSTATERVPGAGVQPGDLDRGGRDAVQRGEPEADAGRTSGSPAATGRTPQGTATADSAVKANTRGDNLLGDQEADLFNLEQGTDTDGQREQARRDAARDKARREAEQAEREQNSLFGEVERAVFYKDAKGNKLKAEGVTGWRSWIKQQKAPVKKKADQVKMFNNLLENQGEAAAIAYAQKLAGIPVNLASGPSPLKPTLLEIVDTIPENEIDIECTECARNAQKRVDKRLGHGRSEIVGWFAKDNPTAEVGEPEGGHDILLVDERYIVDTWYRETYEPTAPTVFDLEDPADAAIAKRYYGDSSKWIGIEEGNRSSSDQQALKAGDKGDDTRVPPEQMSPEDWLADETRSLRVKKGSILTLNPVDIAADTMPDEMLSKYSANELESLSMALGISKSGTKAKKIARIVENIRLRERLANETVESLLATYNGAQLKDMSRTAGIFLSSTKKAMANGLINWRTKMRANGKRFIAQSKQYYAALQAIKDNRPVHAYIIRAMLKPLPGGRYLSESDIEGWQRKGDMYYPAGPEAEKGPDQASAPARPEAATPDGESYKPVMTANSKVPEGLTYEQFKVEMENALKQSFSYTPKQAGFGIWSEQMANLADKYPDYQARIDAEADATPPNTTAVEKPSSKVGKLGPNAESVLYDAHHDWMTLGVPDLPLKRLRALGRSYNVTTNGSRDQLIDKIRAAIRLAIIDTVAPSAYLLSDDKLNELSANGVNFDVSRLTLGQFKRQMKHNNIPWTDALAKRHKGAVADALNRGDKVPSEILADYADLTTKVDLGTLFSGRDGKLPSTKKPVEPATQSLDLSVSGQQKPLPGVPELAFLVHMTPQDQKATRGKYTVKIFNNSKPSILPMRGHGDTERAAFDRAVATLKKQYRDRVEQALDQSADDSGTAAEVSPPDGWRTHLVKARVYASDLGIQEQVGESNWTKLKAIVAVIDQHLAKQKQAQEYPALLGPDSPLITQWKKLKATLPDDAVVPVLVGDFVEFFGDDAVKVAGILDLQITRRNGLPMAGFPKGAMFSNNYKLMNAGVKLIVPASFGSDGKLTAMTKTYQSKSADTANAAPQTKRTPASQGKDVASLLDDFENSNGIDTVMDLVAELNALDELPPEIDAAVSKWQSEMDEDRTKWGMRGDADQYDGELVDALTAFVKYEAAPAEVPKPAPAPRAKVDVKAPSLNLSEKKQAQLKAIQDKLRANLKERLGMNPMLDPENVSLAAQMASLYAEGGVKTFKQFAHNVSVDMADAWDAIKTFLHGAWQTAGAVDETLDDISRTDARAVITEIDSAAEDQSVPQDQEDIGGQQDLFGNESTDDEKGLRAEMRKLITSAETTKAKSIKIRAMAKRRNLTLKQMQERIEFEIVRLADEIASANTDDAAKFQSLLALYNNQPLLSARTSTSIENQAYSTPAPMAFVASKMISARNAASVYEPTAGNGMLLIGLDKAKTTANEIDDARAANLRKLGVKALSAEDATTHEPGGPHEAIIMNPPFASFPTTNVDGYAIKRLEHVIALQALRGLAPDGRAVMILGARREAGTIGQGADRTFLNYLHNHYNVADHFEIDGELYGKQGAKWPLRVVVIDGRRQDVPATPQDLAPNGVDRLNSWEDIISRAQEVQNEIENRREALDAATGEHGPDLRPSKRDGATDDTGTVPATAGSSTGATGRGGRRGGGGTLSRTPSGRQPSSRNSDDSAAGAPAPRDSDSNQQPGPGGQRSPDSRMDGQRDRGDGQSPADRQEGNGDARGGLNPRKLHRKPSLLGPKQNEGQNQYIPASDSMSLETLVPSNMAEGVASALEKLRDKVGGDIDEWVRDKLGYDTIEDLQRALAAEQVDGVALAIDQIENRGALIIADETGIGKGRQAAAVMRYAQKQGIVPVFLTKDAKLFSDLQRDANDIGYSFRPLILGDAKAAAIVNENGTVMFRPPKNARQRRDIINRIVRDGIKASRYDAVILTYSQIQTQNDQQRLLQYLADDEQIMVVMDEAHEASGADSMQGAFVRGGQIQRGSGANRQTILLPGMLNGRGVNGVVYLSATYAKRPDNAPLYFRTLLGRASDSITDLVDSMKRGGVALQQAVAEALSGVGQLVRRERDFSGIKFERKLVQADQEGELAATVDEVTSVFRDIKEFSAMVREAVKGGAIMGPSGRATAMTDAQIDYTEFASIAHNYISQMLLSSKIDAVVTEGVEAFKRGEKPIIALMNTQEALIEDFVRKNGWHTGDAINLNFKDMMRRALDRTLRYSVKDAAGNAEVFEFTAADAGLQDFYDDIVQSIADSAVDLPVSPIDAIITGLRAGGVRVGELTGRQSGIRYADTRYRNGTYERRKKADKNSLVNGFNNGDLDALILNASGSTGLSLHASPNFKERPIKTRNMIIAQPHSDINVMVQTLGRIKRTGMIPGGARYTMPILPLEAERRPSLVLERKMKSLNANTTAAQEGGVSLDQVDFMNRYGDQIIAQYLVEDNPNLQDPLGLEPEVNDNGDIRPNKDDYSVVFTGRMALMPNATQKAAYEAIVQKYLDHIQYLKDTDQYDLEIAVYDDWDGKLLGEEVLQTGTNESNIFEASTKIQQWEIKDTRHVHTAQEMQQEFARKQTDAQTMRDGINAFVDDIRQRYQTHIAQLADQSEALERDNKTAELTLARRRQERVEADYERFNQQSVPILTALARNAGRYVSVENVLEGIDALGMVVDIKFPEQKSERVRSSAGSIVLQVLTNQPGGRLRLPLSQIGQDRFMLAPSYAEESEVDVHQTGGRFERQVISGNPIRAIVAAGNRGRMVSFKSQSGETITGLLMPLTWTPSQLKHDPRLDLRDGQAVQRWAQTYDQDLESIDARLRAIRYADGDMQLTVPSNRSGRKYFLDEALRAITGDLDRRGNRMVVRVPNSQLAAVADRITAINNVRFKPDSRQTNNEAEAIEKVRVINDTPAPADGAGGAVRETGPEYDATSSAPSRRAVADYLPPAVVGHTSVGALRINPDFRAAKYHADHEAASRIVLRFVKPALIKEIKDSLPADKPVIIVPVIASENAPSLNSLPIAYAQYLAKQLDGQVWLDIEKTQGAPNTDAPADQRAANAQVFSGNPPPANASIILVDDTLTTGATLISMADAVGQNIAAVTTLSAGRYGKQLIPSAEKVRMLLDKAGVSHEQFKNRFGFAPEALTAGQVQQYILNGAAGIDGLAKRIPARAGAKSIAGVGSNIRGTLSEESGRQGVTVDAAARRAYLVREGVKDEKHEKALKAIDAILNPVQGDLFADAGITLDPKTPASPLYGKPLAPKPKHRSRLGIKPSPKKLRAIEQRVNAERAAWYSNQWEAAFNAVGEGRPVMRIIPELIAAEMPMAVPVAGMKLERGEHIHAVMTAIRSPYFESFKTVWLDTKGVAIRMDINSVGVLDASLVHPSMILRSVPPGASAVVLSHNHPGGDPSPSAEDLKITRTIMETLKDNGIVVMDHVITNGTRYFSMRESGIVDFRDAAPIERAFERGKPVTRSPRPLPEAIGQAEWEINKLDDMQHLKITHPFQVRKFIGQLADGEKFIHALYTNTRNVVVGVERIAPDISAAKISALITRNASIAGAGYVVLHLPSGAVSADTLKWSRAVIDRQRTNDIKLLDIVTPGAATHPQAPSIRFQSYRESALVAFESTDPYGGDGPSGKQVKEPESPYGNAGKQGTAAEPTGQGPVEVRAGVYRTENPNDVPDGAPYLQMVQSGGKTYWEFRPPSHLDKDSKDAEFELEKANNLWDTSLSFAMAAYTRMRGKLPEDANARPDISWMDTLLSRIDHYSEKVPGLRTIYKAAERWMDNKHLFENLIYNQGEKGEGASDLDAVRQFSTTRKNKAEWKKLEQYLWTMDMNAKGYRTIEDMRNGGWTILDPEGKPVKNAPLQDNYTYEDQAWQAAHEMEAADLRKKGFSKEAAETLLAVRRINDRSYAQLAGEIEAARQELSELGLDMPKVKKADGELGDLFDALAEMGNRRGYYMPRVRPSGRFLLVAKKEGTNPRLETFDTATMRYARAMQLSRDGYKVAYKLSDRAAEAAYMDASLVAMNDLMQKGIENVRKLEKASLESVGLKGTWQDYETKGGQKEKHFIVEGPTSKGQNKILKELGGKWFSLDETPRRWRFLAADKNIEKRIVQALMHHEAEKMQVSTFADTITKNVADLIHQRGSRSHKIGRRDAKGKDVYFGYETDALRAIAVSGKSIAGGTSKRIMAKEFMRAITGQTETWMNYRQRRLAKFLAERKSTTTPEIEEAAKDWYDDYAEDVARNRIDSATQPNAYKDAISFTQEMLRNSEGTERIIGTLKGLTAVKFMSSPASGLVNFTSNYTHVPAAMSAFADIPLTRANFAITKAIKDYMKFAMHERFGKGKGLQGEDYDIYREIVLRGWHEAQFNHEALAVLQTKSGATMRKVNDVGMFFYGVVERLNRMSTIAATYREIKRQHKGEWTEEDHKAALDKGKYVSDKANSIFGKTSLPAWARGAAGGSQALRSWYMFKSFPHNTFLLMKEAGVDKKDMKAAAWLMVAPAIIGGASASLGFKYALIPMVKAVWSALAHFIPGIEPPEDPEEAFYQWVYEQFGNTAARTARYGIVGGLANISVKGSLENRLEDWIPTTMADFLGAPAAAVTDVYRGGAQIATGDVLKGAEQISPRMIANVLRAYRERTQGVTSRSNFPLHYGMEPMKATRAETLMRFTGFSPATIAEMREIQWNDKKIERRYRDRRTAIYDRVRAFHLQPEDQLDYNSSDWMRIIKEIDEYNARIEARDLIPLVTPITSSQVRSAVTRMSTPPKRERIRAWKAERQKEQD